MQPISEKREARFRGPTSSEDFNKWIDDNYYDLVQLFNATTINKDKIRDNKTLLLRENFFLQKKITQLESDLEAILETIAGIVDDPNTPRKLLSNSFSSMDNIISNSCHIDTNYGIAHLPLLQPQISKAYLVNEDQEVFVPKSLKVELYESEAPFQGIKEELLPAINRVETENIMKAFNGKRDEFWQRAVYKDNTIDEIYSIIDIELPQNIINHTKINTLYLSPTPQYSFSLLEVLYYRAGEWRTLSTYPGADIGEPQEIREMGNKSFIFIPQETVKLRLYLKQDNWISEAGSRVFTYGFKTVDIMFSRFQYSQSSLVTHFKIPDESLTFNTVEYVEVVSAKGGIQDSSLVSTKIFLDENLEYPAQADNLEMGTKDLYVEVTMKPKDGASPTISKVNMFYTAS